MYLKYQGEIISFLSLKEEHLPIMVKWRNDPAISNMMFNRSKFTLIKQTEWFRKYRQDKTRVQFIIQDNKTKAQIGSVNLMNIDIKNRHCDWGFYIGEESFRFSGHAIEAEYLILQYAFEKLFLNKVYCQTLSYNDKVISLHKKFGFNTDGILRQHQYKNEGFVDVIIMSILKNEFEKSAPQIKTLLSLFNR